MSLSQWLLLLVLLAVHTWSLSGMEVHLSPTPCTLDSLSPSSRCFTEHSAPLLREQANSDFLHSGIKGRKYKRKPPLATSTKPDKHPLDMLLTVLSAFAERGPHSTEPLEGPLASIVVPWWCCTYEGEKNKTKTRSSTTPKPHSSFATLPVRLSALRLFAGSAPERAALPYAPTTSNTGDRHEDVKTPVGSWRIPGRWSHSKKKRKHAPFEKFSTLLHLNNYGFVRLNLIIEFN